MSRRNPVRREAIVQPPTRKILRYIASGLAGFAARPKSRRRGSEPILSPAALIAAQTNPKIQASPEPAFLRPTQEDTATLNDSRTRRNRLFSTILTAQAADRPDRSLSGQRGGDIPPEVLDVLDAGGEAQQIGRAGRAGALDRGAMLDQLFDAAERGRSLPQSDPRRGRDRRLGAAAHADRQHAAEAAVHLPARDIMAGMVRQPGIEDGGDGRMIGKPVRELQRVAAAARTRRSRVRMPRISRNASNGCRIMPCIWRIVRARAAERVVAREAERAGDDVGMAVEIFGRRVHHDVGAERERPGEDRRRAGRVDREERARGVSERAPRLRCR